ncbi:MAG: alcohol dehydrogenase [Candidatus Roseilinea sp.]|nr:MAG: alcohol dehydrogenase [Candidatus Roseilinea sp.]
MNTAYYIFPDQVHLGFGAARLGGQVLKAEGARHAFVIADPGVASAGLVAPILASLAEAGIAHTLYTQVIPNPDCASVDAAAEAYRAADTDCIIGVGGGSALDTAKATRIVVAGPQEGRVAEYAYRLGDKARPHPPRSRLPFYVAIPTTAGTGAEVTPWAVITDPDEKLKFGVGGPHSVPNVALVDPELMLTLPPFLTAATGMDALTHCIEAYVSTNENPALDPMILQAIAQIGRSLPVAVAQPANRAARRDMAEAAMIGGIAISSKWLGACHSLAHPLSSFANVQHGLANAIMLPHVMRYNLPGAIERYAHVNDALGGPSGTTRARAESAALMVEQLRGDVGLPARLRDAGVSEALIAPLAKAAYELDLNWWTNPRAVNAQVMAQLYREAF